MNKSKLADVLKTFSKEEFRQFGKFVVSPFFNGRNEVIRFYESIKKGYPEFGSKQYSKENIFAKVYPKIAYKDTLMRKLISNLTKLAEEFIIQTAFKKEEFQKKKYLLLEFRHRRLDNLFELFAARTEKLFENEKKNFEYFFNKSAFYNILNGYNGFRNPSLVDRNFQEESDNFFYFFLCKSLEIYARLINQKNVFKKDFKLIFFDEVLKHLSVNNYNSIPLISLHHNYIKLLTEDKEKYFFIIKKLHMKYRGELDKADEVNLYVILRNYCISQIKKGNLHYRKKRFELDKDFLKDNPTDFSEYLPVYFFLNVITNASCIKEFNWAVSFFDNYKEYLYPKYKHDAVNLALAIIDFEKGEFDSSLRHLARINIELCHLKLDVKNLMLKIYYEMKLPDEAISLVDTYRHYLKRDKSITEYNRRLNNDFLKFYSDLIRMNFKKDEINASKLIGKVRDSEYFNNKEWIFEKVEELL